MKPKRTLRQRITFVLITSGMVLVVAAALVPTALGVGFVRALISSTCGGEITPPMPHEDVSFLSSEFNRPTPAWFIPAEQPTGATVIIVPTGDAGRGDRLAEIAVYHQGGFNVLTYSSRVCVGGVPSSLGYLESFQVSDALAYLATRSDVDQQRIGLHGFSAGGAATIMAAARYPAIRAVVAEGGYHDFGAEVDSNAPTRLWFAPFFRLGARAAYRVITGVDMSTLSPVSVIGQIAPRPILLIYGTNEPSLDGARQELAAAGSNAALWEVPGATHGSYLVTAPDEYTRRVIAFMTASLAG